MKKVIFRVFTIIFLLFLITFIYLYIHLHDRHPGYELNLHIRSGRPGSLRAGFDAMPITPSVPDRWTDQNHDARFNLKDGDSYLDLNHNKKFDAVWMAGFQNQRAANGVHDNLWARTMVIDDGRSRISLTVIDAIGFMHDDILDIREKISKETGITYAIIASTHTHEGPDLLGLWGKTQLESGTDSDYKAYIKDQIVKSVESAVLSLTPAKLIFSQDLDSAKDLVMDTRKPWVTDPGIRVIRAIDAADNHTLGTLVSWACHPEILWDKNLLITSDFVHYVREGIEKGIYAGDSLIRQGTGGVCVYINGCIGGLMTVNPEMPVYNPWLMKDFKEPSFQKAETLGYRVAGLALNSYISSDTIASGSIAINARTLSLPLDNPLFRFAISLRIVDRGLDGWMTIRSEISALSIGPATFITVPGEIYPEIVNGGIEAPSGADFGILPVEIPPLRNIMNGKYRFVIGLANDEIGYIIPQSEWDERPPYAYDPLESPYGEINSLGPKTAPLIHIGLEDLIRNL